MLKCGDTFLAPVTTHATEHLWIVITDPDGDGKAIGINVTTKRSYSEATVVLNRGDHPFIHHPSVVNYADAQIVNVKAVQAAIENKPKNFVCKPHSSCSPELLKKIQQGMLHSKLVQKGIKQRCASEWEAKQKAAQR